jgi:multidrug efflux system membrane fusion protein
MTIVVVHSLGGALVCLAGIGLWMLLRELLKPTPAPAAALVQTSDMRLYLTGFGTVQACNSVTVRARVDGALDKVVFVEGQDAKAGELLAQIALRPFQAQFDQVGAAKARDQALLANAELDFQPYRKLVAQYSIRVQQVTRRSRWSRRTPRR